METGAAANRAGFFVLWAAYFRFAKTVVVGCANLDSSILQRSRGFHSLAAVRPSGSIERDVTE